MNDKLLIAILAIGYNIAVGFSILTLGLATNKGDLSSFQNFIKMVLNWFFVIGLFLALLSRILFVLMNSILNRMESAKLASTTITFLITLTSIVIVVLLNWLILKESLTIKQIFGAITISLGVVLLF